MRTAARYLAVSAGALALGLAFFPAAFAQDQQAMDAEAVASAMPPVAAEPVSSKTDLLDDAEARSPKIPDSIKGVIKHLSTATADITLDDLNAAREAVAKLDALIDIEKRLKDLQNLRREREEKSLAGAIPSGAFGMPRGMVMPPPMAPPVAAASFAPSVSAVEVTQITGSNGRYTATIKEFGSSRLVRAGDKLADGSVVRAVTAQGVEVEQGKSRRTVRIKAGAVANDTP